MWKSKGREEEVSDVVQMRLVLAGFREEMAGLGFGPCSSPQSTLRKHDFLIAQDI